MSNVIYSFERPANEPVRAAVIERQKNIKEDLAPPTGISCPHMSL